MATDPEATVRRYYELVDAGEYDGVCACFAPDVVYERPGQASIEGIDDLEQFYREDRPLNEGVHDLQSVVVDGDTVAVRGEFTGKQDGTPVQIGFADFHEFDEDGRISRRYTYTDRDEV